MVLPKTIEDKKLNQYSGKELDLKVKFDNYKNKYKELDYGNLYNIEAATIAKVALLTDTNINIHELIKKQLSGGSASSTDVPTFEFSTKTFNAFIEDMGEAGSYRGFKSLQCAALQKMSSVEEDNKMSLKDKIKKMDELGALFEEMSYIDAYFNAYFRHGKFIQGRVKVSELYEKLKERIKKEAPFLSDNQVDDLANGLFKKLTGKEYADACPSGNSCEIDFAGNLEATKFVTRSGVEYGFPHIAVSVDPLAEKKVSVTEIDWNKIGAEVVKVIIEAVGDKIIGLPADPRSTACKINKDNCYTEKEDDISADEFVLVAQHSDMVDTLVSNVVGKAIRGGWLIALNNEAVASIIESAVGTAAKKVAEKVAYCIYSCQAAKIPDIIPNLKLKEVNVKIKS